MRVDRRGLFAAAALIVVPVAFFGRALLSGRTLCYDDLLYWFYPWKALLYRMAQQGHISLWLPYEFSGMPHMADIQRQVFYPPNLLFYLLPTNVAMVLFVAFHFAVGGVLMYLLLRALPVEGDEPLGRVPSVVGGFVFAFSAFPVLHLSQLPMLSSYAWLPGVLLAVTCYWRAPSWTWIVGGALLYAVMLLGGAPQMVYIASLLAACWTLLLAWLALPRLDASRVTLATLALALVPALALGLCALQLVPMFELASWSSRQAVPADYSTIGTAPPRMLLSFLSPYVYGNPKEDTWQGGSYTYHEECFYVGLLALALAAAALADRRNRALAAFFVAVSVFGVLMALGNHVSFGKLHFYDVMRDVLPLLGRFRVPARWMVWTGVGVAVLAALGAEALGRYRAPRERHSWTGARPVVAFAATALILAGVVVQTSRALPTMAAEQAWVLSMLGVALLSSAVIRMGGARASTAVGILAVLLAADLVWFAKRYVELTPTSKVTAGVQILKQVARLPGPLRIASHTSGKTPTEVATWCPPYGISNVQGTNPLFLRTYVEYLFYSQAGRLPPGSDRAGMMHHNGFFVISPALNGMTRMLNLRLALDSEGGSEERTGTPGSIGAIRIKPLPGAFGVATAVTGWAVLPDRASLLATMYRADFDPTRWVLFSESPPVRIVPGPVRAELGLRRYEDDLVEVSARLDRDAWVVFAEVYYPGWRAYVDGREAPIMRANDVFRAVPVPAGQHTLTMRFEPESFRLGLAVSLATALLMAAVSVYFALRRLRR